MPTLDFIASRIQRLGGAADQFSDAAAIDSLVSRVAFPSTTFRSDVGLFRKMLESYGITRFQDLDDEDLEMEMPLVTGFEFCSEAGFYEGWEEDIPNANDDQVPFANDDYYYYFLTENPKNAVDPIIVAVDHEEQYLPPETYYDLTAGKLLSILQPE